MTTPIHSSSQARAAIDELVSLIGVAENLLGFVVTATDSRYQDLQSNTISKTASELSDTVESARKFIEFVDAMENVTDDTANAIGANETDLSASPFSVDASVPSGVETTVSSEPVSAPVSPDPYQRVPSLSDTSFVSASSSANDVQLLSRAGQEYLSGTPSAGFTELSSAQPSGTSSAGETSLSSAGDGTASTTLSAGADTGGNKYVGYSATQFGHDTGTEYGTVSPGVTLSKSTLQQLGNIANNMSYGAEIFDEIWVEGDEDYGDYYDDFYDDYYGYYYEDGFPGDSNVLIGNPTDQSMLDVSQVTYERPEDMPLSQGEFDAIFEEIMWRAGIDDPVAQDKWYQTLRLIAEHESGFNPAAANGWDSNAIGAVQSDGYPGQSSRGMMQTIPGTFAAYHMGGTSTSIYDPAASMGAAVNYLKARYGCDEYGNGLDAFYSARVPTYKGY